MIFQFLVGFLGINQVLHISFISETCIDIFKQTFNTLLIDIHRESPSTASAGGNLTRCALAAGGVAAMEPLLVRLGEGPFFTLVAGVASMLGVLAIGVIRRKGMAWRLQRESRRVEVVKTHEQQQPDGK